MKNLFFGFLLIALCQVSLFAQTAQRQPTELAAYIKENYTKRKVMISVRDGVKLFTSIYEPKAKLVSAYRFANFQKATERFYFDSKNASTIVLPIN